VRFVCSLLLSIANLSFSADPPDAPSLERDAFASEAKGDVRRALELFLALEKLRPSDASVLQKIARQYSDAVEDLATATERKTYARQALDYSQRAVALAPRDPVNVLSVAISYSKLALHSDTRTQVEYSRYVHDYAQRALALDPTFAWAHHVLGRWHYEVSELGATKRFLVRVFYGGLAPASPAEALRHLRRAVQLEPAEPAHFIELGFALLANREPALARSAFERGLALPTQARHHAAAKSRAQSALARLDSSESNRAREAP
jgi:tetratricopeptide (TPR) repeat protein